MHARPGTAAIVLSLAVMLVAAIPVSAASRPWPVQALSADHVTGSTANHELVSDGGHLYLTYVHEPTPLSGDLVFRRSDDGGQTWTAPRILFSTGPTFTELAGNLAIVANSGVVVVAFRAHTSTEAFLFTVASHDGGTTWAHRVRIARATTSLRIGIPALAMTSAGVIVGWTDRATGAVDIRLSTDGAVTYGAQQLIATTTFTFFCGNPNYTDGYVALGADGNHAYIAWTANPSGGCSSATELLRRSADGGLTWKPRQHLPDTDGTFGWPEIAVHGSRAVLLLPMVAPNALLLVSADAGATFWEQPIAPLDTADSLTTGDADYASDGALWLVTAEYRPTAAGGAAISSAVVGRRSADGGATWGPPTIVASTDSGAVEMSPNLAFAAGRTIVGFTKSAFDGSTYDLYVASLGSRRTR